MILIDSKLVHDMKLKIHHTSEFVKHQITMTVISEQRKILNHWIMLNINAKNIKRRFFAFVNSHAMSTKLLLNFSWFRTVKTQLNIAIKTITIDDKMLNENSIIINSLEIVEFALIKNIIKAIKKENKRIKKIMNDHLKKREKSEKSSSDETNFDIDESNDSDSNDFNDVDNDENFQ